VNVAMGTIFTKPVKKTPSGKTMALSEEVTPCKRRRDVDDILTKLDRGTKTVLVRVDFNVPKGPDGSISDDSRIRGALPTIRRIISAEGCNAVLVSHMGRPKLVQCGGEGADEEREKLSLRLAAERLSFLLDGLPVEFAPDCIGPVADAAVAALPQSGGAVLVLENLRFYKEEEKNDPEFARALAKNADIYINDAFGTAHRAHASVTGVPAHLPPEMCGIGKLVKSEISYLDFTNVGSNSSITAVIGGSKVSTKLPMIKGLLDVVDNLVLGGGLAFTFLKAAGCNIGNSLLEEELIDTAKELMEVAKRKNKRLILPVDARCSQSFPSSPMEESETRLFDTVPGVGDGIEDGWMGLDVGPKTVELFRTLLVGTTKLVFNGPMGVFEVSPFDQGTMGLVDILEDLTVNGTVTVVGGGDSVAALEQAGKSSAMSYISTGGGATLELLSGVDLPGVEAIGKVDC